MKLCPIFLNFNMNNTDKFDAIIFDMDGTLWDAVATYVSAWNKYYQINGIDREITYDFLGLQMGVEEKELLHLMLPHLPEEKRSNEYNKKVVPLVYKAILQKGGDIYNGVLNGLEELSSNYQLFIVSNCPEKTIDCFMQFACIQNLITDSLAHGQNFKSKAENIKLLLNKHNLHKAIYVGDTDSDRIQCEKAGLPFLFVDYGFGKTENFLKSFSNFNSLVQWFYAV